MEQTAQLVAPSPLYLPYISPISPLYLFDPVEQTAQLVAAYRLTLTLTLTLTLILTLALTLTLTLTLTRWRPTGRISS